MKRLLLLALFLCAPLQAAPRRAPRGFRSFEGAWFSVFYPAKWKAAPGQQSTTSIQGPDSARFSSPDGRAQFVVYSPQWNGNPTDLNIDAKREKLVSRKSVASHYDLNPHARIQIETRWQTFRALNGSYTRSIVDVENQTLNTRHVFGFQYKDAASYKKYLPLFQRFKASLEQYAD